MVDGTTSCHFYRIFYVHSGQQFCAESKKLVSIFFADSMCSVVVRQRKATSRMSCWGAADHIAIHYVKSHHQIPFRTCRFGNVNEPRNTPFHISHDTNTFEYVNHVVCGKQFTVTYSKYDKKAEVHVYLSSPYIFSSPTTSPSHITTTIYIHVMIDIVANDLTVRLSGDSKINYFQWCTRMTVERNKNNETTATRINKINNGFDITIDHQKKQNSGVCSTPI